jgi:hypothetical protein
VPLALNTIFKFDKQVGTEPEEVYFRYYLRLADDWNQIVQGGKLPGISGTYGRAGWGGRKSNGKNGWSARGLFKMTVPAENPLAGTTCAKLFVAVFKQDNGVAIVCDERIDAVGGREVDDRRRRTDRGTDDDTADEIRVRDEHTRQLVTSGAVKRLDLGWAAST